MLSTVMSPNIARPLKLRTSPSDYATFRDVAIYSRLVRQKLIAEGVNASDVGVQPS